MELDVTSFACGLFYALLCDGVYSIVVFLLEKARLLRAERKNLEDKK